MRNLITNIPVLQWINTLSPSQQKHIVNGASKQLLICISEIALNIVAKTMSLSPTQISKLKKHEKDIVSLAQKKHSYKKRKDILKNGQFLNNFLSTLMPNLIELALEFTRSNNQNSLINSQQISDQK